MEMPSKAHCAKLDGTGVGGASYHREGSRVAAKGTEGIEAGRESRK
jgi:hypothetical protein